MERDGDAACERGAVHADKLHLLLAFPERPSSVKVNRSSMFGYCCLCQVAPLAAD